MLQTEYATAMFAVYEAYLRPVYLSMALKMGTYRESNWLETEAPYNS